MRINFYTKVAFFLVLMVLFFASCLRNVEEEIIENVFEEESVISFKTDVKPIIEKNCASCHGPNSPNLRTFASIKANAATVKAQVETRQMPIGSSLTVEEINTIVGWVAAGALDN